MADEPIENPMIQLLLTLILISSNLLAQVDFKQNPNELVDKKKQRLETHDFTTFEQASAWADVVAIAQIQGLEYQKVRELNAEGYAYLKVLIPYKGVERGEPIAVVAKGFEDKACYYPDGEAEGERYLVFLKKTKDDEVNVFTGFKPFCQLQILVSETGQYILRTPIDENAIKIDNSLIEEVNFSDPDALLDTSRWTMKKRNEYAKTYACKIIEKDDKFEKNYFLKYTQGVPIYKIRPLLKIKYKPKISSKQI